MALSLNSELPALRLSQYFNEKTSFMEPLSGMVDGSRRTFRTQEQPLIIDPTGMYGPQCPFTIFDANENVIPATIYNITSAEEGAIQFKTAPTLNGNPKPPFYGSFTWADLDLTAFYGAIMAGFYEMEQRFYRGFQLIPNGTTPSPIPGQVDLLVVDSMGNDPNGPNGTFFSTSAVQVNFFRICVAYRLTRNYLWASSKRAYQYREGARGLEINPTSALKLQQVVMAEYSTLMNEVLDQARSEWEVNTTGMGSAIPNPMSNGYQTFFWWQPWSANGALNSPYSPYGGFGPA